MSGRTRQSSSSRVTVTNGEIARAIASDRTLERKSEGLLERLRNFTSPNPVKARKRDFCSWSDDDYLSDDEGSLSSFTSLSSISSEGLNCWLGDDEEVQSGCDGNEDILFQYGNNAAIVSKEKGNFKSRVHKRLNLDDVCFEKNAACLVTEVEADVSKGELLTCCKSMLADNMNEATGDADVTWEAQKSVFKTTKRLLATTTDLVAVLPDLLKLRFFSNDQLERNDWFRTSSSIAIQRAVGERVEGDKNAMAKFLVALRSHNSDLVDKMHQKIADIVTSSKNAASPRMKHEVPDVIEAHERFGKQVARESESFDPQCRYGNPVSRYSRRPIADASANSYDHVESKNHSRSRAYFSKSLFTRSYVVDANQDDFPSRDSCGSQNVRKTGYDVTAEKNPDALRGKTKRETKQELSGGVREACRKEEDLQQRFLVEGARFVDVSTPVESQNAVAIDSKADVTIEAAAALIPQESSGNVDHDGGSAFEIKPASIEVAVSPSIKDEEEEGEASLHNQPFIDSTESSSAGADTPAAPSTSRTTDDSERSAAASRRDADVHVQHAEVFLKKFKKCEEPATSPPEVNSTNPPQRERTSPQKEPTVRRSVSIHIVPKRCVSTPPYHPVDDAAAAAMTSQGDARKRSNSFTSPRKQQQTAIGRDSLLKLLTRRFASFVRSDCDETESKSVEHFDLEHSDVDSYVKELVTKCVISTRSGWLVRRCPKYSERLDLFLQLLVDLNESDVTDIMGKCPKTKKFVAMAIPASSTIHQSEVGKGDDEQERSQHKVECQSTAEVTSYPEQGPVSNSEPQFTITSPSNDVMTQCNNDTTSDDVKRYFPSAPSKLTTSETLNFKQWKETISRNREEVEDVCDETRADVDRLFAGLTGTNTEREHKRQERERFVSHEETREKVENAARCKSHVVETTFNNLPGERSADSATPFCGSLERNSNSCKLESLQSSRLHLFIRNPAAKAKLERLSNRTAKNTEEALFVSRTLFPITTRKKIENRKSFFENSEKAENSSKAEQSATESDAARRVAHPAMPPVLTFSAGRDAGGRLHNHEKTKLASSAAFSLRPETVDNSSDLNNNKCQLATILTNRGSASPPSSAKKKPPHRVSFSNLPPIEIASEPRETLPFPMSKVSRSTVEDSASPTLRKVESGLGSPQRADELEGPTPLSPNPGNVHSCQESHNELETLRANPPQKKPRPPLPNPIDQINELLMDILEEIEAESISLNRCLDDLVGEGLLTRELACAVSSSYDERREENNEDLLHDDDDRERCIEKLLDVLTNLGLETLQKCRNKILGRLCQLSTYTDFVTQQKAAAAATGSPPPYCLRGTKDDVTNDAVNPSEEHESLRSLPFGKNLSSEDPEFSATESDEDIHMLRHQYLRHRHDIIRNEGTITEVDEEETKEELKPQVAPKPRRPLVIKRKALNIRSMLSILTDEEVLEPRQVWLILGAGGEEQQKTKLRRSLVGVEPAKLLQLYESPGLEMLRDVVESQDGLANQRTPKGPSLEGRNIYSSPDLNLARSSSLRTSELHGANNCDAINATEKMQESKSLLRPQEQATLPTAASSVPAKPDQRSFLSPLATATDRAPRSEEITLEHWCRLNSLADQSASVLRRSGYSSPAHLTSLSEESIEELSGLSWMHKARLWVAVENMRLNEFYKKSHSNLSDIRRILDKD